MTLKTITDQQYRTRYLDDLVVGEQFESGWHQISTDEILAFSAQFDRQFFHTDPVAAEASRFEGLIASGAHTFAVWNKVNLDVNGDIAWIAGLGFNEFKFPAPMRADVPFKATSELLSSRASSSDPTRGVVTHLYQLWTEAGQLLFTAECVALVERDSTS